MKKFLLLVVILLSASPCLAGDELEHRHMIYALAITAGYSPQEAKIVSDASWSMDQNNSTVATPGGAGKLIGDGALVAGRLATDPAYAKRLLTNDKALDAEIFTSTGVLSRIGPSAFDHSLMQDPRARDGKNTPGLDLVYHQYIAQEMKRVEASGASEADARKMHLILEGQYMHQMVDSFVHPQEAVVGHGMKGHGPDFAVHNEEAFTQAAFKAMTALRDDLPKIRPVEDDRMKSLGMQSTEKQLAFCGDLVHTIAKSYDTTHQNTPANLDWREVTPREQVEAAANVKDFMNKFLREHGSNEDVTIPQFHLVKFKTMRDSGMVISYEGQNLATVDNLVQWILSKPEYADLVASVRKDVRSFIQPIADGQTAVASAEEAALGQAAGVRMDYQQQALLQVLMQGGGADNAKRLADLDDQLKNAADSDGAEKIVETFTSESKARFRASQDLRAIDGLTAVSMKQVVSAAEKFKDKWNDLPDELRNPGGITRINGFVISGDDVVIVGRHEEGAPKLDLDDLIVGIRAAWKDNQTPLVSLDPDPANVEGDPHVRIQGIPDDSAFALTMLEADYTMKKIMMGVEPVNAPGYRTFKDALGETTRGFMCRFWLYPVQPTTGDIEVSADGLSAMFLGQVRVLSEEMLNLKDGLAGTGEAFAPGEEAADSFSKNYQAIAGEKPVFRKLQGLFDIVLLGRVWHVQGLESPLLDRLCALPHRAVEIPKTYPAVSIVLGRDGDRVFYLIGGVQAKIGAGRRTWLASDDDALAGIRKSGDEVSKAGKLSGDLPGTSVSIAAPPLRKDSSSQDYSAAVMRLRKGDLTGALEVADKMVAADPWDGEPLILRALIQLRRAEYARAQADAMRARNLDPDDRDTTSAAGQIFFQCAWLMGKPDEALRNMDETLELDLQSAGGQVSRGDALLLLDKPDEARKAFLKALELDPASALACARLADLELGLNRMTEVKQWVDRAKALDANMPEVELAWANWEQAVDIRPDIAEEIAQSIWKNKGNSPTIRLEALEILTRVSASRDKWKDVDRYVDEMEEISSGSPEVLIAAAEIAQVSGERKRAAAYLERAEKLAPDHPLVLKLKARLTRK